MIEKIGVVPIFYEQQGYSKGVPHRYFRHWSPRALSKQQSAGDLWSNIAGNLKTSSAREKELVRHISFSIQSVEVHVGRI